MKLEQLYYLMEAIKFGSISIAAREINGKQCHHKIGKRIRNLSAEAYEQGYISDRKRAAHCRKEQTNILSIR